MSFFYSPRQVCVKAVERNAEPTGQDAGAVASCAVAIVCGLDEATADRYEARNGALRSIARRRDLSKNDADALLAYLRSKDDNMRVERVAALKNDIMNLLRNQDPPAEGLVETLVAMLEGNSMQPNSSTHQHPPVVVDYCIQHLGAMMNELDDAMRSGVRGAPALPDGGVRGAPALPDGGVRGVLVRAAGDKTKPYAGTALYSLAGDKRATMAEQAELRRLTGALCQSDANNVARIAAIQLAGERGYADALPAIREVLSGQRRDAVLDIACIGSLGLLGDSADLELLSHFAKCGGARHAAAVEGSIKRIKERAD